jgi:hypothetical protein
MRGLSACAALFVQGCVHVAGRRGKMTRPIRPLACWLNRAEAQEEPFGTLEPVVKIFENKGLKGRYLPERTGSFPLRQRNLRRGLKPIISETLPFFRPK